MDSTMPLRWLDLVVDDLFPTSQAATKQTETVLKGPVAVDWVVWLHISLTVTWFKCRRTE